MRSLILSFRVGCLLATTCVLLFASSSMMAQKYVLVISDRTVLYEKPSSVAAEVSLSVVKRGNVMHYIATENGFYHVCFLTGRMEKEAYISSKCAKILNADEIDSSCLIPNGGCTTQGKIISVSPIGDNYMTIWIGENNYLGVREMKIWKIYGPIKGDWDIDNPGGLLQQFEVAKEIPNEAFWNEATEGFYILGSDYSLSECYKCQEMDL